MSSRCLVTFHAHPDDEAIACGGTIAMAAAAGYRVVLVTATAGELGEVAAGVLAPGETLGERRRVELDEAARILGVARVEILGYRDSGMMGTPGNDDPASFWQASVDEAAERLAAILRAEQPDALTTYDKHGNYGHPDHIQVHRVGVRAAELAAPDLETPMRIYESTMNRDSFARLAERAAELGFPDFDTDGVDDTMGTPEALITTTVDVTLYLKVKKAALAVHRSQIPGDSFFLALSDEAFGVLFGTEYFIRRGAEPGLRETDLFG